ncbi:MAG: histidine ammonia-lyase [Phycisphaerales bacterium]|nr:histidine ammonia-lyase [Phycisphaerales bacterium]MCI0676855.1 histidine ammonia-lyase [Phycisphaerales bacterium]
MNERPLVLDGQSLTLADLESVGRRGRAIAIGEQARRAVEASRLVLTRAIDANDGPIYGVNTGFGSLSQVRISIEQIREVQRNLIRSHAAGIGEPLDDEIVRTMQLILTASLCRGCSGVRVELVQAIVDLLNHAITPVVPARGSVGASGDLAPLAHAALVLMGEGQARVKGKTQSGDSALQVVKLRPITLEAKEGLALINGTHLMAAIGGLALCDTNRLTDAAVKSAAMAIDACRATDVFLDDRLHTARKQPGQRQVASTLRDLLAGSQIITDHKADDPRVQDPYCLRATPQVLGAALDTITHARSVFENELGAVTDNPLVFAESRQPKAGSPIVSGGNFHGMPLAIALDTLKIALAHIAGIAERRIYWLLAASDSENPVNIYLSPQPGLHSGMMIVQYTAAACCNELQTLAHPASIHNIPTSAGIEDYNSMGATSALQARQAVALATNVIAMEFLVMAEAMEYQRPLRSGRGVERTYELVRTVVPRLTEDRPLSSDIQAIANLIRNGAFA